MASNHKFSPTRHIDRCITQRRRQLADRHLHAVQWGAPSGGEKGTRNGKTRPKRRRGLGGRASRRRGGTHAGGASAALSHHSIESTSVSHAVTALLRGRVETGYGEGRLRETAPSRYTGIVATALTTANGGPPAHAVSEHQQ